MNVKNYLKKNGIKLGVIVLVIALVAGASSYLLKGNAVVRTRGYLPWGVYGIRADPAGATPGHTVCSVSYLWQDRVFCGDALELGGCSQAKDSDCDPGRLYDSVLNQLFMLPDETLVFPGHDFHGRTVSTIGEERRHNPFFQPHSRDRFVSRYRALQPAPASFAAI